MAALTTHAGEVKVLSPSAMHSSLEDLAAAYTEQSGDKVTLKFETAPTLRKLLESGERADLVIAPPAVMEDLVKIGKANADGRFELGRVGVGVAVRTDAPVPDISSTEALKRSILAAESLVYTRASSGLYMEKLMTQLGLADAIQSKTVRHHDAVGSFGHLLKGKGREIGFGGMTEIVRWRDKGLKLVGPLPADVQNLTAYTAAFAAEPLNAQGARGLMQFLASPAARAILTANGVQ